MSQIKQSIQLPLPGWVVFNFVKNYSKYPFFIKGVSRIEQVSNADHSVTEWEVMVKESPIRWRQRDSIDEDKKSIEFQLVGGDFADYTGQMKVLEGDQGSSLILDFNIEWDLQSTDDLLTQHLVSTADFASRYMLRSIKQALLSGKSEYLNGVGDSIITDFISFNREDGKRIIACHDHILSASRDAEIVIIAPGYGETKRDYLSLAYYLAANGFDVIRYDATNHVGESDGSEVRTSLKSFYYDLKTVVSSVSSRYPGKRIGLICSSLSKRVAVRFISENPNCISLLVSIVGIVNLRDTLNSVYSEDMIGSCMAGRRWETTDVLGIRVEGRFLEDAIRDNYHDLESTIADLNNLSCPTVFLVAEQDAWVSFNDIKAVYEKLVSQNGQHNTEFHVLPDTPHNIFSNTSNIKTVLSTVVKSCSKFLKDKYIECNDVAHPPIRAIAAQNRLEKNRLKSCIKSNKESEAEFWEEYLNSYYVLHKSPDFSRYLQDLYDSLGLKPGQHIELLDAGCGNGHFGAFLLSRSANQNTAPIKLSYTGLDLIQSALDKASATHQSLLKEYSEKGISLHADLNYICADIENIELGQPPTYDAICMSLVLSYLKNPLDILTKLSGILKKDGVISISSLRPHCDLSMIYKNFVRHANSEGDLVEARNLLSNAGIIRRKESHGLYRFFSEQEMRGLLLAAGFRRIKSMPSFGNQAFVAYATK